MRPSFNWALGLLMALIGAGSAAAQTLAPNGYLAFKGGLNVERAEDDVHGTTGGGGVVAGVTLWEAWALEGEFWLPGSIRTDPEGGRHRDTLFSIALRRSFGAGRVQPHLVVGISIARTEDELTTCTAIRSGVGSPTPVTTVISCTEPDVIERYPERFTSGSLLPLLGAGAEIAITRRLRLIPDVRFQLSPTAVIVRPSIAFGAVF